MNSRLFEKYRDEVIRRMQQKFGYRNKLQTPCIKKIVINMGIAGGVSDIKILEMCVENLAQIAGQKPVITRAKKAISNFKIKKGNPVGCKVTLRRERMYEFLDRLINVALPRIRDFRGLSRLSFDESGNYAFGINEQYIFPEIEYDHVQKVQGMDIIIQIAGSKSKAESMELLELMGVPFRSN